MTAPSQTLIARLLTAGLLIAAITAAPAGAQEDILIDDFESNQYEQWTITGEAWGTSPASGTLPNQMHVSGYLGEQLINSFLGGDQATGIAIREPFLVKRTHLAFLIGGGRLPDLLGIQLLFNGEVVRSATGTESENLTWSSWNISEYIGKEVSLRIFDEATGGWGHINIDHIIQTDSPPKPFELATALNKYRQTDQYMNEPLRPQYHFSPEINWMNDPNGLVYHEGEYHLFHQYNPAGNTWGHMSWGHAVSRDLTHWEHLPLAIPEADGIMAFSGSCVVDHTNSSGLGDGKNAPMIAIYTGHGNGKQAQNLAYSHDRGRTWIPYAGNPVLDLDLTDFRDPKVFWHEPTKRWVMAVSLANEKVIIFYESTNLTQWKELSRFGPAGVINKPNWECPDLFELPIDGEPGKTLWVLEADMGDGSIAGGSGGEYFVGTFDGRRFKTLQHAQWVDHGRDFYAPISWDNIPRQDGRRIWIGWFNNWQTSLTPTSPWRSCMSIPRELSLKKIAFNQEEPATYVLQQKPTAELQSLRFNSISLDTDRLSWPPRQITQAMQISDMSFELEAQLRLGSARSIGLRIRTGENEFTEVGYDRQYAGIYVDRNHSGINHHPNFAGRHTSPARIINDHINLRIFVDRSTIEVFINDGEGVISDRIFPTGETFSIEAFVGNETASIPNLALHFLKSIWNPNHEDSKP